MKKVFLSFLVLAIAAPSVAVADEEISEIWKANLSEPLYGYDGMPHHELLSLAIKHNPNEWPLKTGESIPYEYFMRISCDNPAVADLGKYYNFRSTREDEDPLSISFSCNKNKVVNLRFTGYRAVESKDGLIGKARRASYLPMREIRDDEKVVYYKSTQFTTPWEAGEMLAPGSIYQLYRGFEYYGPEGFYNKFLMSKVAFSWSTEICAISKRTVATNELITRIQRNDIKEKKCSTDFDNLEKYFQQPAVETIEIVERGKEVIKEDGADFGYDESVYQQSLRTIDEFPTEKVPYSLHVRLCSESSHDGLLSGVPKLKEVFDGSKLKKICASEAKPDSEVYSTTIVPVVYFTEGVQAINKDVCFTGKIFKIEHNKSASNDKGYEVKPVEQSKVFCFEQNQKKEINDFIRSVDQHAVKMVYEIDKTLPGMKASMAMFPIRLLPEALKNQVGIIVQPRQRGSKETKVPSGITKN